MNDKKNQNINHYFLRKYIRTIESRNFIVFVLLVYVLFFFQFV